MKITKARSILLTILLLTGLLAGCGTQAHTPTEPAETPEPTQAETQPTESTEPPSVIETLMEQMTLRQKVGQLFIVRPEALDETGVTAVTDAMADALAQYPVGGVVMFSKNIISPEQITAFNEALQKVSAIPMFISVDEEGGLVARLANHAAFDLPKYKNAAAVGSGGDASQALAMGSTIGSYLKEYGFNMDFAPVADVNTNPDNPVIGTRAFSSDAQTTARMASSMAEGLRSQGIIPVFKHFPGHGDTAEDSHSRIAISYKSAEEMRACEWIPFQAATRQDFIMVGHIAVPEITGGLTPSTMSGQVVTGILKEQLTFQGLVITDSLEMGAITESYTSAEAAITALQAGCDILLMPENLREAFDAVVSAIEDGTLSLEWLEGTVEMILQFKLEHGLLPPA